MNVTCRVLLAVPLLLPAACGREDANVAPPVAAARVAEKPGLLLEVKDAVSGVPITTCAMIGYRAGDVVAAVTPSGASRAVDGRHRFEVPSGTTHVKVHTDGYSETWTAGFDLAVEGDVTMGLELLPLAHLLVHVQTPEGKPVASGGLLLVGLNDHEQALSVKDGLVDLYVDPIRGLLVVEPETMPDFAPLERPVDLRPGQLAELTLTLRPK